MIVLEAMSNAVRPHLRPTAEELITKLINGGYLQPALRNDPEAITAAIVRLKKDLRGSAEATPIVNGRG
jgi:hypothetical protein